MFTWGDASWNPHLHGGSSQDALIRLQERSKRVPRGFPEGFRVEDTIRISCWYHFGGLKKRAWDVTNH